MRRQDKVITDYGLIETILKDERICRIALCDWEKPYLVPMVFGYHDGYLYLHSATEGKKIDLLRMNNQICFEVESGVEVIPGEEPSNWRIKYYSVIGFGKAYLIEEPEEKRKALNVIMRKFTKENQEYPGEMLRVIEVIKVVIEEMTGKKSEI